MSGVQLTEQSFGLFEIERVEAFSEPAVDRGEKIAGLVLFALIAKKPRHARGRAQFPGLRLLCTRNRECTLEIGWRAGRAR